MCSTITTKIVTTVLGSIIQKQYMAWQKLQNESTENLIEYIQWSSDPAYSSTADDAFMVFCFRFQLQLLKKLIPICKQWNLDQDYTVQLGEKVFDRFRKYAGSFNKDKCNKEIDTCVLFFLFRIAQNLLPGFKNEILGNDLSPYIGDEEIIKDFPDMEQSNMQPSKLRELKRIQEIIQNALDRLSPKHKIIYLTYKMHEKDGYKLPRKLLESLRSELDLSQATIRSYKKDSFDIVDTYLKLYGSK
ncbi:hypothetical protein GS03_02381 [Flavobacterium sangjuense]|uniref:Uncharacterized protein n=2 Tax=Flavobacterium sangjuense TaxID=2518177 RepID=A0A4P7PV72_9FLAO|nr:hypothetical protein GS03_02381 [Flavobacterium sangjuense]